MSITSGEATNSSIASYILSYLPGKAIKYIFATLTRDISTIFRIANVDATGLKGDGKARSKTNL